MSSVVQSRRADSSRQLGTAEWWLSCCLFSDVITVLCFRNVGEAGAGHMEVLHVFLQPLNKHVIASKRSETNVNTVVYHMSPPGSQPPWAEGIKRDNSEQQTG